MADYYICHFGGFLSVIYTCSVPKRLPSSTLPEQDQISRRIAPTIGTNEIKIQPPDLLISCNRRTLRAIPGINTAKQ